MSISTALSEALRVVFQIHSEANLKPRRTTWDAWCLGMICGLMNTWEQRTLHYSTARCVSLRTRRERLMLRRVNQVRCTTIGFNNKLGQRCRKNRIYDHNISLNVSPLAIPVYRIDDPCYGAMVHDALRSQPKKRNFKLASLWLLDLCSTV